MSHQDPNARLFQAFQERLGAVPPGAEDPEARCRQWQRLCQALLSEIDLLKESFAQVHEEKEQFRRGLLHMLDKEVNPKDFDFSADEVQAMAGKGPSFKELIEQQFRD